MLYSERRWRFFATPGKASSSILGLRHFAVIPRFENLTGLQNIFRFTVI